MAPARPNVVLVLVDDMGFGASSPYGGPCEMPTAQRLADAGLRYSRFHVTSLCSPTRQALLTGRNHHSVGMGVTTEMSTPEPGYNGRRPASAATVAQILRETGYATAAFGKWHQTPPSEVSADGPFTHWPTGEGFDTFYGFMGAEMNHWYPQLYDGVEPVLPDRGPDEGYHLTEDLVDHTVAWIENQHRQEPDRPFLAYLALGATHAPFHVHADSIARYRGRFDAGWDVERERILAAQIDSGVVPPETVLAPWALGVPHWDELDADAQTVAARFMETYAAFASHADQQVGRVIDTVTDLGLADDTIVVYLLGDNGASGEGGIEGTISEHLVGHGLTDDISRMLQRLDEIGSPTTYPIYPVGWALAMNTPYQWTKQIASHYGGTRDGAIISWPGRISTPGQVRDQWHHVIDVLPTILEVTGVAAPDAVLGVTQQPIEGTSMVYTFDDAAAPDRRRTQYFEMIGNRGIYHDGWTASARHGVPWQMVARSRPFDDDVWELYDTRTDWSQADDLATTRPDKLLELQQMFEAEADRYQVFPLDDRVTERENPHLAGRQDPAAVTWSIEYGPQTRRLTEETAPNVKNRSHRVATRFATGERGGVLVAQGGRFGGWSLYVLDRVPCYAYNRYGVETLVVRGSEALRPGRHEVELVFDYDGGPPGSGAEVTLSVDGTAVGHGWLATTTAHYFSFDETFNVGIDLGTPVSEDYGPTDNAFDGEIEVVAIDLVSAASVETADDATVRRLAHQ